MEIRVDDLTSPATVELLRAHRRSMFLHGASAWKPESRTPSRPRAASTPASDSSPAVVLPTIPRIPTASSWRWSC